MNNDVRTWLFDIFNAIEEIEFFISDGPSNVDDFRMDIKTKRAVERNIEIIGEAMNRILQSDCEIELTNARMIVNTRNRIIHGYDTVSDEIVWSIVTAHLPLLKQEITTQMNRPGHRK